MSEYIENAEYNGILPKDMTTFTVDGEPQGKARPRFTKKGHAYTPQKTVIYERGVRNAYNGKILDGKIGVSIKAYFGIPKSKSKKVKEQMTSGELRPTKKPDCDNIAKIICDALNGVAYKDDAQVVSLTVEKHYSDNPRVEVSIWQM